MNLFRKQKGDKYIAISAERLVAFEIVCLEMCICLELLNHFLIRCGASGQLQAQNGLCRVISIGEDAWG